MAIAKGTKRPNQSAKMKAYWASPAGQAQKAALSAAWAAYREAKAASDD